MKSVGLISFAIMLALMSVFVNANTGMSFTLDTYESKLCSCGTVQITGTLQSDVPGVYNIKSDSPWATIAPDTISLSAEESTSVYVYITPDCTSPPKDYPIRITAESDAGLSDSKEIKTTVLPCHSVSISADYLERQACLEENARFSINVTNSGKASEGFIISTNSGVLETSEIMLERGETKTIGLNVHVNNTKKEVIVTAKSLSTYASDSKKLAVNGVNCYTAMLAFDNEAKSACLKDKTNYTLRLKNTGSRDDTYQLNSPFGTLSENEVSLRSGEEKEINLFVESKKEENRSFDVTAVSRRTKAEAHGNFNAFQCRGVDAKIAPALQTICKGFPVSYSIQMANKGLVDDSYMLSANIGSLEESNISISRGGSHKAMLLIPENELEDKNFINIKVTSFADSEISAISNAVLYTENCHKVNSSVNTEMQKICAGKNAVFEIEVENTGKLPDDYVVTTDTGGLSKKQITLAPKEKEKITLTVPTEINDLGKKELIVKIESLNASAEQKLSIELEPSKDCYGFETEVKKDTLYTKDNPRPLFEITVKNTGKDSAKFTTDLKGPSWANIRPKEFVIQKLKNITTYIYASPSFGTKEEAYLMKVTVINDAGLSKTEYLQLVVGNATPFDLSKFKPSITGEVTQTQSTSSKNMYLIFLGVIIIVVIIFWPRIFSKKEEHEKEEDEMLPKEPEIAPEIEIPEIHAPQAEVPEITPIIEIPKPEKPNVENVDETYTYKTDVVFETSPEKPDEGVKIDSKTEEIEKEKKKETKEKKKSSVKKKTKDAEEKEEKKKHSKKKESSSVKKEFQDILDNI